jgi:hypothetical protein
MADATLTVFHLIHDEKFGDVFGLVAAKTFVDIRVTPSGLIRVGEPQRGRPAYAKEGQTDAP